MHRPLSYLAALWAASGSLFLASELPNSTGNALQALNTAVMTIGGTLILLYQRKLGIDRDKVHAADKLISSDAFKEVHARLDAVIAQRDHQTKRNDQLFDQLLELNNRMDKIRCVFPTAEGTARCTGLEQPPCLE